MRDIWTFVTNVQKLCIKIHCDDRGQINTALHEAARESKRYPRLKKIYIEMWVGYRCVSEEARDAFQVLLKSSPPFKRQGVRILLGSDLPFGWLKFPWKRSV